MTSILLTVWWLGFFVIAFSTYEKRLGHKGWQHLLMLGVFLVCVGGVSLYIRFSAVPA